MPLRLNSEIELKALIHRMKHRDSPEIPERVQKASKYHAVVSEAFQIKFPSKKHRTFYLELVCRKQAGEIQYFIREVPFDLPGHYENGKVVRHFVDFGVCNLDGTMTWYEVKGRDLAMGKLKRAQVEEIYGIRIVLV